MIQLLFLVLFVEGALAFLLLVKIGPVRELVIKSLDQIKMGKGPVAFATVACTMAAIFVTNLWSIGKIQNKGAKLGTMSPMDQVLWRTHLLEASLIGFILFLGFIVYRMHLYLQTLTELSISVDCLKEEVEKFQKERSGLNDKEEKALKQVKQLQEELLKLSDNLKKLKLESEEKDKKLETAEAHVTALQKQAADLLLEYDRLLEDNQNLQTQGLGYRT